MNDTEMRKRARELRAEAATLTREAAALEQAITAYARAQFDATPHLEPPTDDELATARRRIGPYLNGHPKPMIDTRYLRIHSRVATLAERRAVAAEEAVWKEAQRP